MASQHEKYDRPYRRGVVLGLSLAEVFLILLFLLLVSAMNIIASAKTENQKSEEQSVQMSALKSVLTSIGIDVSSPDFVSELVESLEKGREATKAIEPVQPIIDALAEKETPPDVISELVEAVSNGIDKNDVEDLGEIFELSDSELRNENKKLVSKIESLGAEKGELPPCWFVTLDRERDPEKEIKIFDVKISDSSITVFRGATIDEIAKADPTANFGLDDFKPEYPKNYMGKPITYTEFENAFIKFYLKGDQRQVQPYRCRFFVGLWDETSSKSSYKKRKSAVENLFYKYEYKEEWPYSNLQGEQTFEDEAQKIDSETVRLEENEPGTEKESKEECRFFGLLCDQSNTESEERADQ